MTAWSISRNCFGIQENWKMTKLLHLISGPRNISTALMYAFGNRPDCAIVDEPMYGVYLSKHSVDHPGKQEILESLPNDMHAVLSETFEARYSQDILFVKNMAHHFIGVDHTFIYPLQNIFLIRDPKQLITSFAEVIAQPTMQDIGVQKSYELFAAVEANASVAPVVVDSNEVLKNPRKVLGALCEKIGIPFREEMLAWKAGPRDADGVWAKYWYKNVHESTGFKKQRNRDREMSKDLVPLYESAKFYYDKLFEKAIIA